MFEPAWVALTILALTVALFLYGRWRHDVVAIAALLACTATGLVPGADAFIGFSHPAVVTVVGVLILSYALERTGIVDVIAERALPKTSSITLAILSVTALGAFFSAFMNNVGALALLMPIALQTAQRLNIPPGQILMPLAFGTILGGMTTLIGTPSNLIVSSFRAQASDSHSGFAMFDFTPVGGVIAVVGVLFVSLVGIRLIPKRLQAESNSYDLANYLTETRVLPDTKAVGMRIAELEAQLHEADAKIVGFLRQNLRINAPHRTLKLRPHDVLMLEADPKKLTKLLSTLGLVFNEAKPKGSQSAKEEEHQTEAATHSDLPEALSASDSDASQAVPLKPTKPAGLPADEAQPSRQLRYATLDEQSALVHLNPNHDQGHTTTEETQPQTSTDSQKPASRDSNKEKAPTKEEQRKKDKKEERKGNRKEEKKEDRKGGKNGGERARERDSSEDSNTELVELVILPGSMLIGRSATDLRLRSHYQINLLAISRQGKRLRARPRRTPLRTGDVLLLQGPVDNITEFAQSSGCAPLEARELRVPNRRNMAFASAIMIFAVGSAALGWWSAALSFVLGILLLILTNVIAPRNLYRAVDWSVVVLLAALIPVAQAIEQTGAASLIAEFVLHQLAQGHTLWALGLLMLTTMFLSDLMNNAATAAIMSPIAIKTAQQLEVSTDTFLMAVAIGASCAFLTPIGHQNNTLILGPGGFKFTDYWRLGLPLDILIISITLPLLLYFWPL